MIIVTGTKRSGTSMWMQILKAVGLPVLGTEFPKIWKETIYDANPHGFYESQFRNGIYYATNPDPKSGRYLKPDASARWAVKVFVPGLCRTDHAFVGQVIGTVRDWREYGTSLDRLFAMEKQALEAKRGKPRPAQLRLEPLLEWWLENFLLVRDVATRGYPARLVSYARVVEEPDVWIPRMLRWVGVDDASAGVATVDPQVRTQFADASPGAGLTDAHREAFDTLYGVAHDGVNLTPALIEMLNNVHNELVGEIETQFAKIAQARRERMQAAPNKGKRRRRSELDFVDSLIQRDDVPSDVPSDVPTAESDDTSEAERSTTPDSETSAGPGTESGEG